MSHSVWSLSGSHRWIKGACPASIRMSDGYEEISKSYAERGTAAHGLGEFCLRLGVNPQDVLGQSINNITVDNKMVDDVNIHVQYIRQMATLYGVEPLVEQRVTMLSTGRNDVFGTSDIIFVVIQNGLLEIVDYKNGYGFVEVANNSQLIGYAISTLDTFKLWDKVNQIKTTVVQPNSNHMDGPVRSAFYPIGMMYQWAELFKESVELTLDRSQKPNAGEWCYWCPAQANCRARVNYVIEKAYSDCPIGEMSIPELTIIYEELGGIRAFMEKVEERVLSLALNGKQFEGYKVVNSYGRAKCKDESLLVQTALNNGKSRDDLYNVSLKSKTDLKRILPAKVIDEFFVTPEPGRKLVPMTDKAPAIRINNAVDAFKDFAIK